MKKNSLLKISLLALFLFGGISVTKADDQNENEIEMITYYDEANNQDLCFEVFPNSWKACMYDPGLEEWGFDGGMYRGDIKIPERVGTESPYFVTGIRCFKYCEVLSVNVPKYVEEITSSFCGCPNLTAVNIAGGDLYRIYGSFGGCLKLKQVNIPEGVMFINSSFQEIGIETIEFPQSSINIRCSFINMPELKSVDLNHTNVVWCESFSKCDKLETVVIGRNTELIEGGCFNDCPSLRRVEIKANTIEIKDSFNGCPAIKEIVVWDRFPSYYSLMLPNSFSDVDFANCTLYVPEGSADAYRKMDGWGRFGKIIDNLPASVESVASESGTATGIYDLMGRRLQVTDPDELPAGLYIINGRKTAIK